VSSRLLHTCTDCLHSNLNACSCMMFSCACAQDVKAGKEPRWFKARYDYEKESLEQKEHPPTAHDSLATANQIHELQRLFKGNNFPENLTQGEAGRLIRSRKVYERNKGTVGSKLVRR
jgi:hypothetical protein